MLPNLDGEHDLSARRAAAVLLFGWPIVLLCHFTQERSRLPVHGHRGLFAAQPRHAGVIMCLHAHTASGQTKIFTPLDQSPRSLRDRSIWSRDLASSSAVAASEAMRIWSCLALLLAARRSFFSQPFPQPVCDIATDLSAQNWHEIRYLTKDNVCAAPRRDTPYPSKAIRVSSPLPGRRPTSSGLGVSPAETPRVEEADSLRRRRLGSLQIAGPPHPF